MFVKYLHLARKEVMADFLYIVQIIIAVAGAFNIEVDVDRMKKFVIIGDFVKYMEKVGKKLKDLPHSLKFYKALKLKFE